VYVNEYATGSSGSGGAWRGFTGTNARNIQASNADNPFYPKGSGDAETAWGTGSTFGSRPFFAVSYADPFTISGTVVRFITGNENPIAVGGATVIFTLVSENMVTPAPVISSITVGHVGEYQITLAPGAYNVTAYATVGGLLHEYVSTQPVNVNGDLTGQTIEIEPVPLRTITGTVVANGVNGSPTPIVGVTVSYSNTGAGLYSPQPVQTGAGGAFTIRTGDGEYDVAINGWFGGVLYTFASAEPVTVAGDASGVVFTALAPPAPLPVVLVSPADAAVWTGFTPALTWTADATGALPNNYTVYLDTDPEPAVEVYSGSALTFTPATPLYHSTVYYWKVVPSNNGMPAEDCPVWSFTTRGLVVGATGTATVDMPMYPRQNYSMTQVIYTGAELAQGGVLGSGEITEIYFQAHGNGGINFEDGNNSSWLIYMGGTTKDIFEDATDFISLDDMTEVKDGVVSTTDIAANEWLRITLDTPFTYSGTGNIVIFVNEYSPDFTGGGDNSWAGVSLGGSLYRAHQYYSTDGAFEPKGDVEWTAASGGGRYPYRPNLAVTFISSPEPPLPAVLVSPADRALVGSLTPTLSWNADTTGGSPTHYTVYLDTLPNPATKVFSGFTGAVPAVFTVTTPLMPSTTYYWKVVPSNEYGTADDCPVWSFTTLGVVVGATGTSQMHMPMGAYTEYSISQAIYTEAELAQAGITGRGEITHLFYQAGANGIDLADGNNSWWLIKMGATTKNAFADAEDLIPHDRMTQVKGGVIANAVLAANEWVRVELETSFMYPGTGNIVIFVNEYGAGSTGASANMWNGTNVGATRGFQRLGNDEPYIPKGRAEWSVVATGTGGGVYSVRPNLAVTFSPSFYAVSGSVIGVNGAGMGGVNVHLQNVGGGMSPDDIETAGNGEFTFDDVVDGVYAITLSKPGFEAFTPAVTVTVSGDDVEISPIEYALVALNYVVTGAVVDADGAGMSGVNVRLQNTRGGASPADVQTGGDGVFTFPSVLYGVYTITLSLADYQPFTPTATVLVDSNPEVLGQIVYALLPVTYTVSGRIVRGATPAPVAEAVVSLPHSTNAELSPEPVTTDGSGVFSFVVVAGEYSLTIQYLTHALITHGVINVDDDNVTLGDIDITALSEVDNVTPSVTGLRENYPNPFNPTTTIAFDMARSGYVDIDIYNIRGQKVRSLVSGEYGAGTYSVVWNGDDATGRAVGSGMYFYRMTTAGYSKVNKMVLLK